jgi:cytochrome c oxidase subunit 2
MKIVVDTPEEYAAWLKDKATIAKAVNDEKLAKVAANAPAVTPAVTKNIDSTTTVAVATPVEVK